MIREQAIKVLKNTGYIGNDVGVAFDVAIKSMDKLEKIGQITDDCDSGIISCEQLFLRIKEILEKE